MAIWMTGATGFVGQTLLPALLKEGEEVFCLVRPGSEAKIQHPPTESLRIVRGDITEPSSYIPRMEGCDTIIHLVGIIREFPSRDITYHKLHVQATENLVQTALKKGIRRMLHMSAMGARPRARARYHQTKFQAEEIVRRSGLKYTIFQPSVIFGPRDQFTNRLAEMVKWNPVTPLIGGGKGKMQPVAAENVSEGVTHLLREKRSFFRTYAIGGPEIFTLKEIFRIIKKTMGIWRPDVPVPVFLIKPIVKIMERYSFFPLTYDQLIMLGEDNVGDSSLFYQHTNIHPIFFRERVASILKKGGDP